MFNEDWDYRREDKDLIEEMLQEFQRINKMLLKMMDRLMGETIDEKDTYDDEEETYLGDRRRLIEEDDDIMINYSINRRPLIDIIRSEENLMIYVDIPGTKREEIAIKAKDNDIIIMLTKENKRICKEIPLKTKIKPETIRAKYRNGVLEIKAKRKRGFWRKDR